MRAGKNSKRTISTRSRFEPLQIVSESRHRTMCQRGGWVPKRGGHEAVCQQWRWATKGGGLEGPTSLGEEKVWVVRNGIRAWHWAMCQQGGWAPEGVNVNTRRCVSKDTGFRTGVDWGVSYRLENETSSNEDVGPQNLLGSHNNAH